MFTVELILVSILVTKIIISSSYFMLFVVWLYGKPHRTIYKNKFESLKHYSFIYCIPIIILLYYSKTRNRNDELIFLKGHTLEFCKCSRAIKIADIIVKTYMSWTYIIGSFILCLHKICLPAAIWWPPALNQLNIWKHLHHFG